MGANAFSRPQTRPDLVRMFSQVKRFPFDSASGDRYRNRPGFPGTEEVTGSNPVRPTRLFLFLALPGRRSVALQRAQRESERLPPAAGPPDARGDRRGRHWGVHSAGAAWPARRRPNDPLDASALLNGAFAVVELRAQPARWRLAGRGRGRAATRAPCRETARGAGQAPAMTSLPPTWFASITRCASAISSKANTRAGLAR